MDPALAWVMERVFPVNDKGPFTIAEVICPVPFPVRRPPKVVEPVPPRLVASVVVPMTPPVELVKRSDEVMDEIARVVEVACDVVELPVTRMLPETVKGPTTVDEAWEMNPFEVVKKVEDAYGKTLASEVEVAVKYGAMCWPYEVTMPLMVAVPATARRVPGEEVAPIPTLPWLVTVKKVEVA